MSRFTLLVAGACAATMGLSISAPAFAEAPQGFAGTLSGSYTDWNLKGPNDSANLWSTTGQAAFGLGQYGMQDLAAEFDGGYHSLSNGSAGNLDIWNAGGHLFWAPAAPYRLGATLQYEGLSSGGFGTHLWQYGAFGEYYVNDMITLGLNGGAWSGPHGSFGSGNSGGYVGGGATAYVMPDLALTGQINYFSGSNAHLTSYSAQAEYLVSETTPVSVFGGYTFTDVPGPGSHINEWLIGVKFYTNGNGTTLVDKHRDGALDNLVRPVLPMGE
ncbi:MAG TPA: hypothetical protein VHT51_01290 [Micropepsaceae bacterium]|nr:hypothetical protein [Micropepsaceae bacterium]